MAADIDIGNLLSSLPNLSGEELFETLHKQRGIRIERIVSPANTTTEIFDQDDDEWVALLQGEAVMRVGELTIRLKAGDYLMIPARTPHQVLKTSETPLCVWLAIHHQTNNSK